jgi:hypothetical protein
MGVGEGALVLRGRAGIARRMLRGPLEPQYVEGAKPSDVSPSGRASSLLDCSGMAVAKNYVLQRMAMEVRYRDGIVFLDKCGSLMVALERALGEPFKGGVPTMEHGELTSVNERLVLQYGPKGLLGTQQWLETPARLEKVFSLAWGEVSKKLDVEDKVTHCGLRTGLFWASDSIEEAAEALYESGLIVETGPWEEVFRKPKTRVFSAVSKLDDGRSLRSVVDTVSVTTEGRVFPDEEKFAPAHAIQVDLDFFLKDPGDVPRERLHKFIRASLSDLTRTADHISQVLHADRP